MLFKFTLDMAIYGGIGFVIGAFTPSVGRSIKAWITKEEAAARTALETKIETEVLKIWTDIKSKV